MKKTALFLAIMMFAGSLAANANTRRIDKDVKAILQPSSIELAEQKGRVAVDFSMEIPKKFVRNRERFVFTPVMTDFNRTQPLQSIVIEGKKFYKVQRKLEKKGLWNDQTDYNDAIVIPNSKEARVLNYSEVLQYRPWMKNANLIAVQKFMTRKETAVLAEDVYAKGVKVTEPKIVIVKPVTKTVINRESGKITVNFKINSDQLDLDMDNNSNEVMALKRLMAELNNPNVTIESIRIIGSSSPDGNTKENTELAQQRADALKNYMVRELNIPKKELGMIQTLIIAENWDGLEELVKNADIQNKGQVTKALDILNVAQRKAAMKALPQFNFIKNQLLPQLRYAAYEVNYSVKNEVVVK